MFLLVNPPGMKQGPHFDIPTNILYLVAALREAGVPVDWVDGNMVGMQGVQAKIDEMGPKFVGVSCLTPVRFSALAVCEYAHNRGAKAIMGGFHPHFMWRQIMDNYPYVDAIVFGEGEGPVVDIATLPWGTPVGIVYRPSPGVEYIRREAKPYAQNLDCLPFPAWDTVDFQAYQARKEAIGPRLYFSRGCTGHCKFCNTPAFWRGYRARSPENFCDEAQWLLELGKSQYVFGDDNISHDAAMALFTEMFKRFPKIAMPAQVVTRVDCVSRELLRLMKACGVSSVVFGAESGSQRILDHLDKRITVGQSRTSIKMAQEEGLGVVILMMRNIIDERPEDKAATERLIQEMQPVSVGGVNALWLFPGTRYWKEVITGQYDHLIKSGKEWVTEDFFLDPKWAQYVIQWVDGVISPTLATEG